MLRPMVTLPPLERYLLGQISARSQDLTTPKISDRWQGRALFAMEMEVTFGEVPERPAVRCIA